MPGTVQPHPVARFSFHVPQAGICHSDDAFVLEELSDGLGNILIFTMEQPIIALHDGYAAAQTTHSLGKFETDIATTENQQMFGDDVEFQGLDMRKGRGLGKTWYVTNGCPGPSVDKVLVAMQNAFASPVQ